MFDSTSHNITLHVNELIGCDLLSGNEIHQCVKENRVGLSPPCPGSPTRIPDDHFQMIAQALWMCISMDQTNCNPNQLN